MKIFKIILALGAAIMLFAACTKDGSSNSVTIDGKTYTNVKATYFIENEHFFWLSLTLTEDGKTTAKGLLDTPAMERNLGRAVKIADLGYGDRLILDVEYPGENYYNATPESGTQTFKKKDSKHYEIILDAKDDNGKVFKMNLVAEYKEMNY